MQRLDYETLSHIDKGQRGDEDELIQYRMHQADNEGNVDAMMEIGDLYYWGSRGIVRDQARAFDYFHRAAELNNVLGQLAGKIQYIC